MYELDHQSALDLYKLYTYFDYYISPHCAEGFDFTIYDISGLVDYSFGNYKILPRDIDDIDEITSTYFQNIDTDFTIYPNPCNLSVLQLSITHNSTVKIFSSTGKMCFSQHINPGKHSIDISKFSKGIYLVSMNNTCKKLIIK